ncbi:MAG: aminotransferase class I/II-fold pyridoxal phosphate-dependent enzyme, partial [Oscillospiraceae bacterium]|nr:aminotransferase class I/II-fold pyridoxal phosphate-dependent enzyme [Oscillospiraceae bacterium]
MDKKCSVPAKRMENVYASVPRKILERARQLEKQGRTIAHMEIGEPDFDTPRPIIDATIAAMNANKTHYESNRGNALLRKKICDEIYKSQGLQYDPDAEILMTAGVAPGIFYSVMAFAGEGDEVITFGPAFMNYDVDIML